MSMVTRGFFITAALLFFLFLAVFFLDKRKRNYVSSGITIEENYKIMALEKVILGRSVIHWIIYREGDRTNDAFIQHFVSPKICCLFKALAAK